MSIEEERQRLLRALSSAHQTAPSDDYNAANSPDSFQELIREIKRERLKVTSEETRASSIQGPLNESTREECAIPEDNLPFYPPGWDRQRLLDSTSDDLRALGEEQRTALMDGLKATYGEDGFQEIFDEIDRRYWARIEAAKTEEEKRQEREIWAPYIRDLDLVFKFQNGWAEWGFVIFRTTPFGAEHDAQWKKFRERWDRIFVDEVSPHLGTLEKVDKAIELLRFSWVEDPALEGASPAEVSRRFDNMNLPRGLSTAACLMITPASMESVLNSPLPTSAPHRERQKIPFAVAVSRSAHYPRISDLHPGEDIPGADFKGYFNVAVEGLLRQFYAIVALDIMDLYKLTVKFKHDNDIWCSADRWGIHHYEQWRNELPRTIRGGYTID